jgi:hypothetical protein
MNAIVCGLLSVFIATSNCPHQLPLTAGRFGRLDAATGRQELDGAIAITNRILSGRVNRRVTASWDSSGGVEDTTGRTIYLFLVASPTDPNNVIKQQKALEAHLADFHRAIKGLPSVDPRYENCSDLDACAKKIYSSYNLAAAQIDVVYAINALDTAEIRDVCDYCIIIQSAAFQRYCTLYGTTFDGTEYTKPEYLAVFLILHEVGH